MAAKPVPSTDTKTLGGFVRDSVEPGSAVHAEGSGPYGYLWEYTHEAVNLSAGEYVGDAVHTSNIEGFWSLFECGYCGIHHWMTTKHLHRYLNEFSGRAGICSIDTMEQMEYIVRRMVGKTLTNKRLTV